MRFCVTGGNGFIGKELVSFLLGKGFSVNMLVRNNIHQGLENKNIQQSMLRSFVLSQNESACELSLKSVDVVIHLSGLAHSYNRFETEGIENFRSANVEPTKKLAKAAVKNGVRRFVFVSTIAVYGSNLIKCDPINEKTTVDPVDDYAKSKLEAEEWLRDYLSDKSLELVVIRPALVVGRGAPGNLKRLRNLVARGWPIPIVNKPNRRSYVCLSNLTDLLFRCATHENAPGEIFVASEKEWPSTKLVIEWIGDGMGRKIKFANFPAFLLKTMATFVGKKGLYEKIYENLNVDSSKARSLLDWRSHEGLADAFKKLGAS